jgi:OFA family oxalate/formate antiporter-like MFS transporter
MTETASTPRTQSPTSTTTRWWQLFLGVISMSMVANLQYGWTLFVDPINDKFHWGRPAIQVAFSVFVLVETWLVPAEGYLVDRFGPKLVGLGSGILVAAAWAVNSVASSLPMLYLGAVLGGIGVGGVYGATVGNALKWFPDRRGLAAGLTAMGFGAGSAFTVVPIANMIKAQGYEATFLKFGLVQGLVVFIVGWFLRAPDASFKAPPARAAATAPSREHTPMEMVRTPAFWVMFVMFVLTATFGLIVTAQLTPIAKDFQIADVPASLFGITLAALPFALSVSRIFNGVSRPFFGWVSDQIGREYTMFVAFLFEGAAILMLAQYGHNPAAFVALSALVFFGYGEIYSLFPAACGDAYGRKFASANAGLLYCAKGAASLLVPLSGVIAASRGWGAVFVAGAAMNILAAILALAVLKPMRVRSAQ